MSPFDFINAICDNKKDLFKDDPLAKKDYNAFIVNRGLSYFSDTVLYANEMNRLHHAPKDWQFSFLLNSITKKKRFSKWNKKEAESKNFSLVKEYFGYSDEKAKVALTLLTDNQLMEIEQKLYKGGK
jgi:hypothetical protein